MASISAVVVARGVGLKLLAQGQGRRRRQGLGPRCIENAGKLIEDVGLGDDVAVDSITYCLLDERLVVMQQQGKDIGHPAVASFALDQRLAQAPEARRHLGERRAVPQRPRLPLHYREATLPRVYPLAGALAAVRHASVPSNDAGLGLQHDALGVGAKTFDPVGQGGRYAETVALEDYQAGWRNALRALNEAVERRRHSLKCANCSLVYLPPIRRKSSLQSN